MGQKGPKWPENGHEPTHPAPADSTQRKRSASQELPHSRNKKHTGRLFVETTRCQELQTEPQGIQPQVPHPPLPPRSRSVCEQKEQANQELLQLENRQVEPGQCVGFPLGIHAELAQSALGVDWTSSAEAHKRQSNSHGVPTNLENISLVAHSDATSPHPTNGNPQQAPLPEPTGRGHACPTLGNPFCRSGRLTKTQLAQCLRRLESLHDIPIVQRTKWLQDAKATYPEHRLQILAGIKRLKANSKSPRYPIFFHISPIVAWAFPPSHLPHPSIYLLQSPMLLDRLLIKIRLTTLMRASDISSVP